MRLTWTSLAWATSYKIYRAPTSEIPTKELVTVAAPTCTYLDTTGKVEQRYFYWVEAIGPQDTTECKDAAGGMKQKKTSTITYTNLKGATHTNPATYTEGESLTFTAPSAVVGYTFSGWMPAQIAAGMTGPQTVTAGWTANAYAVKFNANGGTGTMANEAFTYDVPKALTANTFARTGYTFNGWAMAASGTKAYSNQQTVSNLTVTANGTVNLYAVWQCDKEVTAVSVRPRYPWNGLVDIDVTFRAKGLCSVAFEVRDVAGGTNLNARTFYLGNPEKNVRNLNVQPGAHRFVWDAAADLGEVEGISFVVDVKVADAIFQVNVTGGNGSGSYRAGQTITLLTTSKTGYAFAWNGSAEDLALLSSATATNATFTMPSHDVAFTATTTANAYKVAFNANGGSGTMANQSFTYDTAQALTANAFTRTGYTFQGWGESASATTAKYTDKQSVKNLVTSGTKTLYAVWKANAYTVAFNANGGSGTMANESFTYDATKALTANAFTRTGYTFLGWGESASATTAKYTDKQSVKNLATSGTRTLYAVWQVNSYTVVFNANGGAGTMANQSFTGDTSQPLAESTFTRLGYTFLGWAESVDTTTPKYTDGQSVQDLGASGTKTLYAVWSHLGIQLWENGPYWAECNVGATLPEEGGYYFRWGGTVGYTYNGNWVATDGSETKSFFTALGCVTHQQSVETLRREGYIDEAGNLVASYDAATVTVGAPWRTPTVIEWQALITNTVFTKTSRNGIAGFLVSGVGDYNSKSIFLPTRGRTNSTDSDFGLYWSATPNDVWTGAVGYSCAYSVVLYNPGGDVASSFYISEDELRYTVQSIRPVIGADE